MDLEAASSWKKPEGCKGWALWRWSGKGGPSGPQGLGGSGEPFAEVAGLAWRGSLGMGSQVPSLSQMRWDPPHNPRWRRPPSLSGGTCHLGLQGQKVKENGMTQVKAPPVCVPSPSVSLFCLWLWTFVLVSFPCSLPWPSFFVEGDLKPVIKYLPIFSSWHSNTSSMHRNCLLNEGVDVWI